jgi:hypothetical protein
VDNPGALPLIAQAFARREDIDAVVAVAAVIRGHTPHHDTVLHRVADGLACVALDEAVPIGDAVVAADNETQLRRRLDSGAAALRAVLRQVDLLRDVRTEWSRTLLPPPPLLLLLPPPPPVLRPAGRRRGFSGFGGVAAGPWRTHVRAGRADVQRNH